MLSSTNYAPKSKDKVSFPKLLDSLSGVLKVICGRDHCIAITSSHEVYSWGNNDKGQLGIAQDQNLESFQALEEQFLVYNPTLIETLLDKKIDNVATGTDHSFAWSMETGEVYAWGSGAYGKLGFGDKEDISQPQLLDCFNEASSVGLRVRQVVCGDDHSMAILENVEEKENNHCLFVWGCSKSWQLGMEGDGSEDVLEPHVLDPEPWEGKIRYIAACNNYSCAVTRAGQVYTWGSGEFGRLGYQTETRQQKVPRIIKELTDIQRVSLGIHHAIALTSNGLLFSWGRGINGQLGHGEIPNEDSPKLIKALAQKRIVDITCGENHTLAVTENREIYSWGAGQFGQLGHGDLLRQSLPNKIVTLESHKIVQVSAGRRHSVALDDKGRIFVWGCNDLCQLGLKTLGGNNYLKKRSQMFPEAAKAGGSVLTTISDSTSPKEKAGADLMNNRIALLSALPSGSLAHEINSHNKQVDNKEPKTVEELIEENRFLKYRIRELELRTNLNTLRGHQQNLYDKTAQYFAKIEEECSTKKGSTSTEIIARNVRIDEIKQDFRKAIKELNSEDMSAFAFCVEMFDKLCDLKKKSNYAVSQ